VDSFWKYVGDIGYEFFEELARFLQVGRIYYDLYQLQRQREGIQKRYSGKVFRKDILHPEGGDTLNRLPKEAVDAPSLEAFKARAGCGSGQPGLVVGDPAHGKGLEPDDHCGPFQPRPNV